MAILLYCLADPAASISDSTIGVGRSRVFRVELGSVTAFVSENADSAFWLKADLQIAAVQFHEVQMAAFNSATIIPVRFPTIFENEEDLRRHVQERSAEYSQLLKKFAGMAQMEVKIQILNVRDSRNSGTDYLHKRQKGVRAAEETSQQLKTLLSDMAKDWRQTPVRDGVRGFVLVQRAQLENLRKALRSASVPDGLTVRVSGPWPVSEFLADD